MSELTVRLYSVRFGDAILVTIPERDGEATVSRHLLIDVGNVSTFDEGGADAVFDAVVRDIERRTGGVVDLYVMTHEHLDHCQGLLWAKEQINVDLAAKYAWLTRSAAPDYYRKFPDAEKQRIAALERYIEARAYFGAEAGASDVVIAMLRNNEAFVRTTVASRTADCVEHLRTIAPKTHTHYVSRETNLEAKHPFTEVELRVLAPEADASAYYRPRARARLTVGEPPPAAERRAHAPEPPAGVDAGAFFDLVAAREQGLSDELLAIDKAANNTSIVLELAWRGWRLLFTGDAEEKSWDVMAQQQLLRPVHFAKISHHGSHNGTPDDALLEQILPLRAPDRRRRVAAVSTFDGTYGPVPDEDTLEQYRKRCYRVFDTRALPDGECHTIRFRG
jgi:beta-lactamase superfamily II metal-dependent hydrolase